MKKALRDCVCFANFCHTHNLLPHDVGTLIDLTDKAFAAGVRECNTNQSADRQRARVEKFAAELRLTTRWPGLGPLFKNATGNEFTLPSLS
jgi:hypothetical protein